jgi:hypothetical protein
MSFNSGGGINWEEKYKELYAKQNSSASNGGFGGGLQDQLSDFGNNWGKKFGSMQDIGSAFKNMGSLSDVAKKAGGAITAGMKGLGAAAMANPVGLAIGAIDLIGGIAGKTSEAKAQKKAFTKQIGSYREAQDEATEFRETTGELNEMTRDVSLTENLGKVSEEATKVKDTTELAYEKSGGLTTSGEIEAATSSSNEKLDELSSTIETKTTDTYQEEEATADASLDSFMDESNKAIAELQSKRSSLKTKWYQNIV